MGGSVYEGRFCDELKIGDIVCSMDRGDFLQVVGFGTLIDGRRMARLRTFPGTEEFEFDAVVDEEGVIGRYWKIEREAS